MSPQVRRPIVALVAHARQVPAVERERFASRLRVELHRGALILETCHRVEAYTTSADDGTSTDLPLDVPAGGRVLSGNVAVRHAVSVATGSDSIVLGEDQILHQLRESLEVARTSGVLDPEIDRLFALALQAGRRARSWRSGRQRSLADVALDSVARTSGSVRGREILVVGAGRMGELMARAAAAAGASVTVANRSTERARAVTAATGGGTSGLDPGTGVDRFAAIFVALGGPWVIGERTIAALLARRPAVVDVSVPSAVPAALAVGLGSQMVTADDLVLRESEETRRDSVPDPRSEALIEQTVQAYLEWQARRDSRAAADALVRRADLEREAELAALWKKLPTLDPESREAIETMTRHLAARLLRQPLERLGRDADGVEGRTVRDLFAL
ncbi:MAG: NAD(P)-binding domain-containing protein [Chloroflexota bacterium]